MNSRHHDSAEGAALMRRTATFGKRGRSNGSIRPLVRPAFAKGTENHVATEDRMHKTNPNSFFNPTSAKSEEGRRPKSIRGIEPTGTSPEGDPSSQALMRELAKQQAIICDQEARLEAARVAIEESR